MHMRQMAAQDGEDIIVQANGQAWIASWHSPLAPPDGTPHGASGVCFAGEDEIVLISPDGEHWGLPGGRTEGSETWEETLRRELHEEACATVVLVRLLGFSRSICVAGTQKGLILNRSFWRAEVELAAWEPQFEIPHRRVFPQSDVREILVTSHPDGSAPIVVRAFHEARS